MHLLSEIHLGGYARVFAFPEYLGYSHYYIHYFPFARSELQPQFLSYQFLYCANLELLVLFHRTVGQFWEDSAVLSTCQSALVYFHVAPCLVSTFLML